MISVLLAKRLNEIIAAQSGGSSGIRDYDSLSSALYRPFQTFDNEFLYATPPEKAAAMMEIREWTMIYAHDSSRGR